MLNTKQTEAVTWWLRNHAFRDLGHGNQGYHWVVCGNVNLYFLFDKHDKIVDVQTD